MGSGDPVVMHLNREPNSMTSENEPKLFGRFLQLRGKGAEVTFYQPFQIGRIIGDKDKLEHVLMAFFTEDGLKNLLLSPSEGRMKFPQDLPNNEPEGLATISEGSNEQSWSIVDRKVGFSMCWPQNFFLFSTSREVEWSCEFKPKGDKQESGEHIIVRGPFDRRVFVPSVDQLVGKGQRLVDRGQDENRHWYVTEYTFQSKPWKQIHCEAPLDQDTLMFVTGQCPSENFDRTRNAVLEVAKSVRRERNA